MLPVHYKKPLGLGPPWLSTGEQADICTTADCLEPPPDEAAGPGAGAEKAGNGPDLTTD